MLSSQQSYDESYSLLPEGVFIFYGSPVVRLFLEQLNNIYSFLAEGEKIEISLNECIELLKNIITFFDALNCIPPIVDKLVTEET